METLNFYIRKKILELNRMSDFEVGTETVLCWIDNFETLQASTDKSKLLLADVRNCHGCKWLHSDDRNSLCPICNSNYDMYEKL